MGKENIPLKTVFMMDYGLKKKEWQKMIKTWKKVNNEI